MKLVGQYIKFSEVSLHLVCMRQSISNQLAEEEQQSHSHMLFFGVLTTDKS